jgi:hypothetical protein
MKVTTPQVPYTQDMEYPSIAIVPMAFTFAEPLQEDEVEDVQPYTLLVNVGDFEGSVEVRVAANSAFEREEIEQRILELMLSTEFAPGYLGIETDPVRLGGVQYLHRALASFELAREQWREEMVFSNERYSYLTLDTTFPALVSRGSAQQPIYTIETLVLAINHDLASDVPDEQRQVHQDGSITVYP